MNSFTTLRRSATLTCGALVLTLTAAFTLPLDAAERRGGKGRPGSSGNREPDRRESGGRDSRQDSHARPCGNHRHHHGHHWGPHHHWCPGH